MTDSKPRYRIASGYDNSASLVPLEEFGVDLALGKDFAAWTYVSGRSNAVSVTWVYKPHSRKVQYAIARREARARRKESR